MAVRIDYGNHSVVVATKTLSVKDEVKGLLSSKTDSEHLFSDLIEEVLKKIGEDESFEITQAGAIEGRLTLHIFVIAKVQTKNAEAFV